MRISLPMPMPCRRRRSNEADAHGLRIVHLLAPAATPGSERARESQRNSGDLSFADDLRIAEDFYRNILGLEVIAKIAARIAKVS